MYSIQKMMLNSRVGTTAFDGGSIRSVCDTKNLLWLALLLLERLVLRYFRNSSGHPYKRFRFKHFLGTATEEQENTIDVGERERE
jgi:hypothetical protein